MPALLETCIQTSAHDLDRALATRYPALLVFEAPGAEPCRALEPLLEDLAQVFVDRARVIRVVDADEEGVASRFGIPHVPTLVFRRHGREVARIEGAPAGATLERYLSYLVGEAVRPEPVEGPRVALRRSSAGPSPSGDEVPAAPLVAGDGTFDWLVRDAPMPVLVDFWAGGCGPCRTMGPILEQLAREHPGRLRVVKVDTDANPATAHRYGIGGFPTFVLFRNGKPVFRVSGVVSKIALEQAVEAALSLP